jgi:hypothetical protein
LPLRGVNLAHLAVVPSNHDIVSRAL